MVSCALIFAQSAFAKLVAFKERPATLPTVLTTPAPIAASKPALAAQCYCFSSGFLHLSSG
jgi:hypothetical protein